MDKWYVLVKEEKILSKEITCSKESGVSYIFRRKWDHYIEILEIQVETFLFFIFLTMNTTRRK